MNSDPRPRVVRDLDAATAQVLWDQIMWCTTRQQLQEVARRIRDRWSATPEQREANKGELDRLRKIYDIRYSTMIDPRGGATY